MEQTHTVHLITHSARLLVCAKEFAPQFLAVLMRCGASENIIGRGSPAYGLLVMYTFFSIECIPKNFLFWEAPSQTKTITFKSAASSFWTASQTSGNNWSAERLCVAKGMLRSMNSPLTINTSMCLASGRREPGV